jgi:hypothetical protein
MNSLLKLFSGISKTYRLSPTVNSLRTPNLVSKGAFRYPRHFSSAFYLTMAADSEPHALVYRLDTLGIKESLHKYPNCHPEVNPVDVYRAHLTSILTELTGVAAATVYSALAWTQTLDKGDLVLPVPALRVKDKKPTELAEEWAEKVIFLVVIFRGRKYADVCNQHSSRNHPLFISLRSTVHFFNSTSRSTNWPRFSFQQS